MLFRNYCGHCAVAITPSILAKCVASESIAPRQEVLIEKILRRAAAFNLLKARDILARYPSAIESIRARVLPFLNKFQIYARTMIDLSESRSRCAR